MPAVGSRPKTVDVRSDLRLRRSTWPFAVSTSGFIDRSTISYMQSDIGKALFLTLKKGLEQGMIGDDKDFSGKVCVKWKDAEFDRQIRSESLIPRGASNRQQQ